MMRALYTAATGMLAEQTNVDTIANNLSNVNTTGYKMETRSRLARKLDSEQEWLRQLLCLRREPSSTVRARPILLSRETDSSQCVARMAILIIQEMVTLHGA